MGVQSSAIVVQSLAKGNQLEKIITKVGKEATLGLFNAVICSSIIFAISYLFENLMLATVVSISLFIVIIFAAINGTLIPLVLNKYKIDPALATGPFVTTLNDVLGLFIYFTISLFIYHM